MIMIACICSGVRKDSTDNMTDKMFIANKHIRNYVVGLKNELKKSKEKEEKLEEMVEELKQKFLDTQLDLTPIRLSLQRATVSNKKLAQKVKEKDIVIEQLKTLRENDTMYTDLKMEVRKLKLSLGIHGIDDAVVNKLQRIIRHQDENRAYMFAKLILSTSQIDILRKSNANVVLQKKSLQEDLDTTRMKLDEKCQEARKQNLVIVELQTQNAKLVRQNDELKIKVNEKEKEALMKDKAIRDSSCLATKLEDELNQQIVKTEKVDKAKDCVTTNLVTLQSEVETLQSELNNANEAKDKLNKDLRHLDSANEHLRSKLEQSQKTHESKMHELQREKQLYEQKIKDQTLELESLLQQSKNQEKQIELLKHNQESLQKYKDFMQGQGVSELRRDLFTVTRRLDAEKEYLYKTDKRNHELTYELSIIKKKNNESITELQNENMSLKKQIHAREKSYNLFQLQNDYLTKRVKTIGQELNECKEELSIYKNFAPFNQEVFNSYKEKSKVHQMSPIPLSSHSSDEPADN